MMLLTLGSSILQVAFQCHDIVEAIPYFQIWECLFLVHMNNAALNFVLLPFFGNSFVRTSIRSIYHSHCSIVKKTLSQHC